MTEAGHGAVHNAGVDLLEHIIAKAQLFHGAGTVVLQNHIGLLDHFLENFLALRLLQVQRHADLAAVEVGVIHAVTVDEGAHLPGIIAALGIFDLDDRCAHVRQQRCGIGAGQHAAKVQHYDSIQQTFHTKYDLLLKILKNPPYGGLRLHDYFIFSALTGQLFVEREKFSSLLFRLVVYLKQ